MGEGWGMGKEYGRGLGEGKESVFDPDRGSVLT